MAASKAAQPRTHYGAQTKARKTALDLLYSAELRDVTLMEALSERATLDGHMRPLTRTIVEGVTENLEAIDARIKAALPASWSLERMPSVDRALARMAVFELDYTDTPASAVVAEAVRLAGDLSTDESPSFLNGVLGQALSSQEASDRSQPKDG